MNAKRLFLIFFIITLFWGITLIQVAVVYALYTVFANMPSLYIIELAVLATIIYCIFGLKLTEDI